MDGFKSTIVALGLSVTHAPAMVLSVQRVASHTKVLLFHVWTKYFEVLEDIQVTTMLVKSLTTNSGLPNGAI